MIDGNLAGLDAHLAACYPDADYHTDVTYTALDKAQGYLKQALKQLQTAVSHAPDEYGSDVKDLTDDVDEALTEVGRILEALE